LKITNGEKSEISVFMCVWKLRQTNMSIVMSVCPSVRMKQLDPHCTDCNEIWFLSIFRNIVAKIKVLLKSYDNNGYYTCISMYIYDNVSLISIYHEKLLDKSCRQKSNMYFIFNKSFLKMVQTGRPQKIIGACALRAE